MVDSDDVVVGDSESESDTSDSDTNWQYDTADAKGGPDQECYSNLDKDKKVSVWCDNPLLIAQQCDENELNCCCRQPCAPAMCPSTDVETVPCSYLELFNTVGYCNLAADVVPVDYVCNGACVPQSQCGELSDDGECRDSDMEPNGLCLLYEVEGSIKTHCQLKCDMDYCDETHMCAPLYQLDGAYKGVGACLPIR